MDEGLKKRLIGAAVLASLAVIFIPMLFEEPPSQPPPLPPLPQKPPVQDFASAMLREEVPVVTPLAPAKSPPNLPPASPPSKPPVQSVAPREPALVRAEPIKARTGLTAWVVQAASLSSRESADRLVAKLRQAKLPTPDPELVEIRGKRYFRVRVGPVIERAEAEGLLDKVSSIAGAKAQVRQYP